jgi:hypothetical protein
MKGQGSPSALVAACVQAIVLSLILTVAGSAVHPAAAEFDPGKAGFSVRFRDEITPYRVTGVFVLPGERLRIEALTGPGLSKCTFHHQLGRLLEEKDNHWVWEAPGSPGSFPVTIHRSDPPDSVVLNVFVMVPFENLKGEWLNGYRIGNYPRTLLEQLSIYKPPAGFVEITESNMSIRVGPHFTVGQFLCKQNGACPMYLVLKERLILKLELILEKVNVAGYRCDTFHIMSGYRTPHYNQSIGNVKYSRHLWGGAADIFVDCDPEDCMMDDLNGDGRSDYRDADIIYDIIDGLYGQTWYERFLGGLAKYKKTTSHGPFVHVDVRGTRARWGD